MALSDLSNTYPSRANAPDGNYSRGSTRNDSTGTAADGTPYDELLLNDIWGAISAVIVAGGVSPSGNPDTDVVSDFYDALAALFLNTDGNLADLGDVQEGRDNLGVYSQTEIDDRVSVFGVQLTSNSGSDSFNVPAYFQDKKYQLDIMWDSGFSGAGSQTLTDAGAATRFDDSLTNGRGGTSASYGAATLPAFPATENTVEYNWNGTSINGTDRVGLSFIFREIV
jgi:hypothetical protein